MRAGVLALLVAVIALPSGLRAQPADEQPADEQPADEQPADEQPADEQPTPEAEREWARGVSPERQQQARQIASEGVEFFAKGQCAQALQKYRQAIALWDHPAMRYNIAECLMQFGQLVDAYENLEQALRYGAAPFDSPAHYSEGLLRRKLLLEQLAHLEVTSDQPDVNVSLDGKPLFVGPGSATRILVAGQHQLVASKEGHLTVTRQLLLEPGKLQRESLVLLDVETSVKMERRWRAWLPWTIVGAGAAMTIAGVPMRAHAQSQLDRYDERINATCDDADGCTPSDISSSTRDLESSAHTNNKISIGLFAVGGATLVAGMTMVLLNQPRAVKQQSDEARAGAVRIVPVLDPDHIAVFAGFSF